MTGKPESKRDTLPPIGNERPPKEWLYLARMKTDEACRRTEEALGLVRAVEDSGVELWPVTKDGLQNARFYLAKVMVAIDEQLAE